MKALTCDITNVEGAHFNLKLDKKEVKKFTYKIHGQ